jgi:hypothetical protein
LALKDKVNGVIEQIQTRKKGKSSFLSLNRERYDPPVLVKDPLTFFRDIQGEINNSVATGSESDG